MKRKLLGAMRVRNFGLSGTAIALKSDSIIKGLNVRRGFNPA
jgi:hypothetical protein